MKENEKWIKAFKEKLEDYSEPDTCFRLGTTGKGADARNRKTNISVPPMGRCRGCRSVGGDDCCKFVFPG